MHQTGEQEAIQKVLKESRTVAVVGLSSNPERPSYDMARYLQQQGYRIIPVNPNESEVLGERAYPDLLSIPEPADIVDISRRPEVVPPIIEQRSKLGPMQCGCRKAYATRKQRHKHERLACWL